MRSSVRKSADPVAAKADLVVVCVPAPPRALAGAAAAVDAALGGLVAAAVKDGEIDGKAGSATRFHTGGALAAPRAAVVGVGGGSVEDWRSAGTAAASVASRVKTRSVALVPPDDAGATEVEAFIDGFGGAVYRYDRFRTPKDVKPPVGRLLVHSPAITAADLARADRIVEAVDGARRLGDTPSNHLTPTMLGQYAKDLADGIPGLTCQVIGPSKLEKMGAGALLAVAQGTEEPPRMIVLRYSPKAPARPGEVLGLVGKAVTFDSGGISIKPSGGMEEMKLDMGGGAAVIEGIALIAALGLPVEVVAVVPSTENMPSGTAVKPGDVITAMNGKTIEVINTDAEGRLILADALTYAAREGGATRMIDMATLTGAVVVALGEVYAGLFGSDGEWTDLVRDAGESSGDLAWPLPMHDRYRPLIESRIADLTNSSNKRQAGPVYAAQFLREFTDGLPWCHLDIAGTGMVGGRGTGYGVRLILSVAERLSEPAPL